MDERSASLGTILAQLSDPRGRRGRRHPWRALVLLVVVGLLSGANSQNALARWVANTSGARRQRLGFGRQRAPSLATIHRLLQQIDVLQLEALLGQWLRQVRTACLGGADRWLDGLALDGKTLRGARRLGAQDVHLLSACSQRQGLVLGQQAVPDTTSELGAVGPFLASLPLTQETLTFDALFTHWLVAQQVVDQGGAYLMLVKDNQAVLRADIARATSRPWRQLGQARSVRLAHGRLELRTLRVASPPPDLGFPHAAQLLRLHRRTLAKATGAVLTDETTLAITSLRPDQATPAQLLRLWLTHWRIEVVHWVRDVVFGEDASTTRTGRAPQALAAFRNLALSLIHLWRGSQVTAAREYFAAHPATLFRLLGLPSGRL